MLISDSHQFIFFHVAKAAGTSVRNTLQPYCLSPVDSRWISILRRFNLPSDYRKFRFLKHTSVAQAEAKLPAQVFTNYRRVAFVRNPWDRLVSQYIYHFRKREQRPFADYVQQSIRQQRLSQSQFLADSHGRVELDFVGRYEDLETDYQRLAEFLQLPLPPLPKLNASKHQSGDYRRHYDTELQQLLEPYLAEDMRQFDYTF